MAWSISAEVGADESFFDGVDTDTQAYWLGFIVGDGSLRDKSGLKITLQKSDRDHLEKFKSDASLDTPVSTARRIERDNAATISVSHGDFCRNLHNLGVKSDKVNGGGLPEVDYHLQPALIRGYFDADGGWWDDGRRKRWSITAKSRERLEKTNAMLSNHGIDGTIYSNGEKYFKLEVRRNDDIESIWHTLYPEGMETEPMLERKAEHIKTWVNE